MTGHEEAELNIQINKNKDRYETRTWINRKNWRELTAPGDEIPRDYENKINSSESTWLDVHECWRVNEDLDVWTICIFTDVRILIEDKGVELLFNGFEETTWKHSIRWTKA